MIMKVNGRLEIWIILAILATIVLYIFSDMVPEVVAVIVVFATVSILLSRPWHKFLAIVGILLFLSASPAFGVDVDFHSLLQFLGASLWSWALAGTFNQFFGAQTADESH